MTYFIPFAGMPHVLAFHGGLTWLLDALSFGLVGYCVFLVIRDFVAGRKKAKKERSVV